MENGRGAGRLARPLGARLRTSLRRERFTSGVSCLGGSSVAWGQLCWGSASSPLELALPTERPSPRRTSCSKTVSARGWDVGRRRPGQTLTAWLLRHHRAVDLMYSQVKTPYIFHCEDDWFFDQPLELDKYIELLNNDSNANIVCLRKVSNFILTEDQQTQVKYYETNPLATARLDYTHAKWHGYTFNPHIARIETWKKTGGFYKFKKERDVSIFFRSQGKYNLFLKEGVCHHIGENSVSYPQNQSFISKLKSKFYGYPVA